MYEGKNEKASSCQESNLQLSNHSRTITILYMYGKVVLKASVTHYVAARCETEVCSDSNRYVSSRLMTMAFIALPSCVIWVANYSPLVKYLYSC